MTDAQILGIAEGSSLHDVKKAFRKKVKEIHPDTTDIEDALKNHLLFIEINNAYRRLMGKKVFVADNKHKQSVVKAEKNIGNSPNEIIIYKDPAYVFYKTAMTYYMKIHPSQWNTKKTRQLNNPKTEEEIEEYKEKVRVLANQFPRAYYYFSIVVNEYPDSSWYKDAKEKMMIIEERTKIYKKIIESFSEFMKILPRSNRGLYK